MAPEEYNRQLVLARASLWSKVFMKNYKTGKTKPDTLAAVHADAAVGQFNKRFLTDLNVTRLNDLAVVQVSGQAR